MDLLTHCYLKKLILLVIALSISYTAPNILNYFIGDHGTRNNTTPMENSTEIFFIPDEIHILRENETLESSLEISTSFEELVVRTDPLVWCVLRRSNNRVQDRLSYKGHYAGHSSCRRCGYETATIRTQGRKGLNDIYVVWLNCLENNSSRWKHQIGATLNTITNTMNAVDFTLAEPYEWRPWNLNFILGFSGSAIFESRRNHQTDLERDNDDQAFDFERTWDLMQCQSVFLTLNASAQLTTQIKLKTSVYYNGIYASFAGPMMKENCKDRCVEKQDMPWVIEPCINETRPLSIYTTPKNLGRGCLRPNVKNNFQERENAQVSPFLNYYYFTSKTVKSAWDEGESDLSLKYDHASDSVELRSAVPMIWSYRRSNATGSCSLYAQFVCNGRDGCGNSKSDLSTARLYIHDTNQFNTTAVQADLTVIAYSFLLKVDDVKISEFAAVSICFLCSDTNSKGKCVHINQILHATVPESAATIEKLEALNGEYSNLVKSYRTVKHICQLGIQCSIDFSELFRAAVKECPFIVYSAQIALLFTATVTFMQIKARQLFEEMVRKAREKEGIVDLLRSTMRRSCQQAHPKFLSEVNSMYISCAHTSAHFVESQLIPRLREALPSAKISSTLNHCLGRTQAQSIGDLVSSRDIFIALLSSDYATDKFLVWEFTLLLTAHRELKRRLLVCRLDEYFYGGDVALFDVDLVGSEETSLDDKIEEIICKLG